MQNAMKDFPLSEDMSSGILGEEPSRDESLDNQKSESSQNKEIPEIVVEVEPISSVTISEGMSKMPE